VKTFNAGMRDRKTSLYDGGHRVPCFIRWPAASLREPGDIDELTTCQDMLPTLIDLCGLKPPAGAEFDGASPGEPACGNSQTRPEARPQMIVVYRVIKSTGFQVECQRHVERKWRLTGKFKGRRTLYISALCPSQGEEDRRGTRRQKHSGKRRQGECREPRDDAMVKRTEVAYRQLTRRSPIATSEAMYAKHAKNRIPEVNHQL